MTVRAIMFGVVLLGVVAPAQADDCDGLRSRAEAVLAAKNVAAAKAVYAAVRETCNALYTDWLGTRIAGLMFNRATAGDVPDEAMLNEALQYGRPWQLLATLGDIAAGRKDWDAAARDYDDALGEIGDAVRTPQQPSKEIVRRIFKKGETARLLATSYVPTRRGRGGENVGMAAPSIRGVAVVTVAVPVTFVFAKTEFTEKGLAAAEDMADYLKNQTPRPASIKLVGHTDPIGSDESNLVLSRRRAEELAAFLRQHGVGIAIETEGRGKSEPFKPDQPGKYSEEEQYQMDRRVELVW